MYHKIEPQSALPPATQMHFTGRRNTCWKYGKYTCMVCHIRCSTRYGCTMLYQNWMRRIFSYSAILVIIAKETASKLRIVRPSKLRSHDYCWYYYKCFLAWNFSQDVDQNNQVWVDDKDASRPKAARSDFDERRVRFGVDSRGLIIVVGAPDGLGHQLWARWRDKNSTEFINKEPPLGATSLLTLLTLPSQNVISTPKNHQHNLNCWNLDLGLCRKDFGHFQLQTKLRNLIPSWHSIHCNTWPQ